MAEELEDCPFKTTCEHCGHYDYEMERCNLGLKK